MAVRSDPAVEKRSSLARVNSKLTTRGLGVIASIDVLRAKVQLQSQQQQLIAEKNQLAIDKLTLARVVGLPNGQQFDLSDKVPFSALKEIALEEALLQARATRPDYIAAKAQVRAAELSAQAAAAQNYPWVRFNANYGDIGSPNFGRSHGTFLVAGTLNIPLFLGTQVRAFKLQANTVLQDRKAQLADLDGKIDDQVRTAFFNLRSLRATATSPSCSLLAVYYQRRC